MNIKQKKLKEFNKTFERELDYVVDLDFNAPEKIEKWISKAFDETERQTAKKYYHQIGEIQNKIAMCLAWSDKHDKDEMLSALLTHATKLYDRVNEEYGFYKPKNLNDKLK